MEQEVEVLDQDVWEQLVAATVIHKRIRSKNDDDETQNKTKPKPTGFVHGS